jgi:hypothetical protein
LTHNASKKTIAAKVLAKRRLYKYKKVVFASEKHKKIKNVGIHAKNITQGRVQSSAFDFLRLTRLSLFALITPFATGLCSQSVLIAVQCVSPVL